MQADGGQLSGKQKQLLWKSETHPESEASPATAACRMEAHVSANT